MSDGEFGVRVPVEIDLFQKGLPELTQQFRQSLEQIASAGLSGNITQSALPGLQAQVQQQAQASIAAARASIPDDLVGPQLNRALEKWRAYAREVNAIERDIQSQMSSAVGPGAITASVNSELQARYVESQRALVLNSKLLGQAVPQGTFADSSGRYRDILNGSGQFVTPEEAAQQREAFAAVQKAMIGAQDTLREYSAIVKQGLDQYVRGEAAELVVRQQLAAQIKAEADARLAGNKAYIDAEAQGTLAQRDIASRVKQQVNSQLLGTAAAPVSASAGVEAATGQEQLGKAATTAAAEIDAIAVRQREASVAVSDSMLKSVAVFDEIAAISREVPGGIATYVETTAQAAFAQKFLTQQIETETLERQAASDEYIALTKRASTAEAKLTAAIDGASATAGAQGATNPSTFQKLQAYIGQRQGQEKDPLSYATLGQSFSSKLLTTGQYAVSAAAFYGAYSSIRSAVEEANAFQVAMVNLQETMKATDDAGEFPKTKQAILDLSSQFGIAGSQVAQITTVFRGAFGNTTKAINETKEALQLATATGLSIADVTNTVLAVDQAFHTTTASIGDVTLSLQNLTGVSAKEQISALGQIAPVADQVGLSLKQTAALFALSEKLSGRSAQTIAENFNRILPAIQKNGVAILGLIQTVPGLDKQFQTLGADLNAGSEGKFFVDLAETFNKLGPVAQNTIIQLLGGRREAGALIPILTNVAKYNDLVAKSSTNNGLTAEFSAKQLATLSKQLQILKTDLQNIVGDLFRSGLAAGFTDALKVVEFLVGGLQEVESVLKDINNLTHGVAGQLAGLAALYGVVKGGAAVVGGIRSIGNPAQPIITASTQAGEILIAAAEKAGAALAAGGEAGGGGEAAGGFTGLLGPRGQPIASAAPEAAAAGADTGEAALIGAGGGSLFTSGSGTALALSDFFLPVGLTLAGFSVLRSALSDAKAQNEKAKAAADKFTESYLKQRSDLDDAINDFLTGNKFTPPSGILTKGQTAEYDKTNKLVTSSKNFQDLSSKLIGQAQDAYKKDFNKNASTYQRYLNNVNNVPGLGPAAQVFEQTNAFTAGGLSHLPIIGGIFGAEKRVYGGGSGGATEFAKQFGDVSGKVRQQVSDQVLVPFFNQYIADIKNGTAKALISPNSDLGKGLTDKGRVLGLIKGQYNANDPQAAAEAKKQAKEAVDQLTDIKKGLTDDVSKKNYDAAIKYIDEVNKNPGTSQYTKQVLTQLKSKVEQAKAVVKLNDTTTDLDTQKQLVAAGQESYKTYLVNVADTVDGLIELQQGSPLTPPLRQQLATEQKELSDTINQLADQAQQDADFLAGLSQGGAQLAATKYADAVAKFKSLPTGDPNRVQAAQDAITAFQALNSARLGNESPGQAYRDALNGVPLPGGLVDPLVENEKKDIEAEEATAKRQIDAYNKDITRLKAAIAGGDASKYTKSQLSAAEKARNDLLGTYGALQGADATLDPTRLRDEAGANTSSTNLFNKQLLGAGDNPVAQAQAQVDKDKRDLQIAKKFQDGVTAAQIQLQKDQQALILAENDFAYQTALGQNQVQQALDAGNPEALAQDLVRQGQIEAQQAAKLAAQGQTTAAQQLANQAAIDTINGHNQAVAAQFAIKKAGLDVLAAGTDDPVELAKIAIQQADIEAAEAAKIHDKAGELEAAAHKIQAQHQLADAMSAVQDSFDQLAIAIANFQGDAVKAANIAVDEAVRHLEEAISQHKSKNTIAQKQQDLVNTLATQRDNLLQSAEDTIQFQLDMNQISVSTAIALYQALLKTKNITVPEQRQIQEQIHQLLQSLNQDLQFNLPSDLQLPTLYEARRFVQGGGAGAFAPQTAAVQNNDNRQITVNVSGAGNPAAVASAVVQALNVPTRYATRPRIY